jgi:FtsZ-binding cell division protein ZapB
VIRDPVVRHVLFGVLCSMEDLMVQLETARQERVRTLKEFMRLKNELAVAQRRCDELRSENNGLKHALLVSETELQALHSYAVEVA